MIENGKQFFEWKRKFNEEKKIKAKFLVLKTSEEKNALNMLKLRWKNIELRKASLSSE